ncbi:jg19531 [Pararge aegeria aegeria]|uniref:Jg19531 protein n=1 Tax=Pararge aegeria aegeria TaxID=348720 RepID=A0A8S4R9T1_9NEOP|nr:jg19531 [Pararge aegeria aegeria]
MALTPRRVRFCPAVECLDICITLPSLQDNYSSTVYSPLDFVPTIAAIAPQLVPALTGTFMIYGSSHFSHDKAVPPSDVAFQYDTQ